KTIGELSHCVYNSLAYSYKKAIDELEDITKKRCAAVCIVGGGSRNDYLNGLTAKHCGRAVTAGPDEGAAAGNIGVQIMSADKSMSYKAFKSLINTSFNIKEIKR
ncbi:MAG: rhamnulokinase, partial [Clostridiales bacterium]|nr:rhamnulokinase [Clostridiales bacterium]